MVGVRLLAPRPKPGPDVVERMLADLDRAAAEHGPLLVGGVSLGAQVAASWAVGAVAGSGARPHAGAGRTGQCAGLLVAMPAWIGAPGTAVASSAALASADLVEAAGVDAALAHARSGAPPWIADELDRAWPGYGQALASSLRAAAATAAPSLAELCRLDVPAGVAAVSDDPVHPLDIAAAWTGALPNAALVTTSLAAVGRDRRTLGRATVLAWLRAQYER